ncbi:MAG TPA: glycoside hydrolase family 95 protein [Saprospiraceae bacterium]|nr:glycoside hydrolase family 95 protein [Saprospiraceae bacterium]
MRHLIFVILFLLGTIIQAQDLTLWYDEPSKAWEDALPIGNGRIGAMVYGNPVVEYLQLNDDSMWPGSPEWENPPATMQDLEEVRRLLLSGEINAAEDLYVQQFSRKSITRSHQTLGDLNIRLGHQQVSTYRRELDLRTGIAAVSYLHNGYQVTRRILASTPDRVMVMEITTTDPRGLNFSMHLSRPLDHDRSTAVTTGEGDRTLHMQGEVTQLGGKLDNEPMPINHGVLFDTRVGLWAPEAQINVSADSLMLRNSKKVTIYIVNNTSYYGQDFVERSARDLQAVLGRSFDELADRHIQDYQGYFNRVSLDLEGPDYTNLTTTQRLERVREGADDPGLEALLFHYGRYLLISCSRPGTNPANLQGLWNRHIEAPWNADYHLNINIQMNYWPAEVTNLSDLTEPFFSFVDRVIERGKSTAQVNYGMQGAVLPHATDLWAPAWLRAATPFWGSWLGAGGWLMQHYWQHFAFTGDESFLRERAYPAMREIATFYGDYLIEDPRDHQLVMAPSSSPENQYFLPDSTQVTFCLGSAIDQQIVAEVFDHFLKASELLDLRDKLYQDIKAKRSKLRSGTVIGPDGRLLEWDRPYAEPEPGHRHMSHLYAFHPGDAITRSGTPDLFQAVRNTLQYRLDHGGAGTGWSRAWLINFSARLQDGNMAHDHIRLLLQKSITTNLFDMHPPFQIDGNFGYTAGIAEMLIQSHEDHIAILPALPDLWASGSVSGLKARGNFEVSIKWEDHQASHVLIAAPNGGKTRVQIGNAEIPVDLAPGESFTWTRN